MKTEQAISQQAQQQPRASLNVAATTSTTTKTTTMAFIKTADEIPSAGTKLVGTSTWKTTGRTEIWELQQPMTG